MRIKVCGVTTPADAAMAAGAGAVWIGLNFHRPSPRFVDEATAGAIISALPEGVEPVGLFVERSSAEIGSTAARLGLRVVQVHGEGPPDDLAALRGLTVVRAFRLGGEADLLGMAAYLERAEGLGCPPSAVLVDAFVAGQAGGTGRTIPPDLLDRLPRHSRLILAGGLTPENVAGLVARVRPWMVDVASGVESAPGRKDPAKVSAFVRAVRDCG